MAIDWNPLAEWIRPGVHFLLICHVRPDGDSLGSEIGLAELLKARGASSEIINPSSTPTRYHFIDPDREIRAYPQQPQPLHPPDVVVVLDTGTWSQLDTMANYVRSFVGPRFVIDHHQTQDDIGAIQLIDREAPACGLLIFRAFCQLGVTITHRAANALFLAIAMDTGWMRHPNSTAEVFASQAALVEAGADPSWLYQQMFETNSLARLRLMAKMLERIQIVHEGRLATSLISREDLRTTSAHPMDTEDFIVYLMTIVGVDTAIFAIEQDNGDSKISFRSRGRVDCAQVAAAFGGGGHRAAAGARVAAPPEKAIALMVDAVEKSARSTPANDL